MDKWVYAFLGGLLAMMHPMAPAAAPLPKSVVLTGWAQHPDGEDIVLRYDRSRLGKWQHAVQARATADGRFRLSIPALRTPGEAELDIGSEPALLYLHPGDVLQVSYDAENYPSSMRFKGAAANPCNYLLEYYRRFQSPDDSVQQMRQMALKIVPTLQERRRLATEERTRQLAFLKSYAAAHPLPAPFRQYARRAIQMQWASWQLMLPLTVKYANAHDAQAAEKLDFPSLNAQLRPDLLPDTALTEYQVQQVLELYGNNLLFNRSHFFATGQPLDEREPPLVSGSQALAQLTAQVRAAFGRNMSADLAVGYVLAKYIQRNGPAGAEALLDMVQQHTRDPAVLQALTSSVQHHQALKAGQPAPTITLVDDRGKKVSLADFKGKVVYLDFWASWCAPCLAEAPAAAKLRKHFVGRDVLFLCVSIDSREGAWQKALAAYSLRSSNTVHLRDGGEWEAATAQAYLIGSVPSYIIIGRDGRLMHLNAPRPSDAKTTALLEKALQE
ncbi:TlpA family protein disulfide reductase [Hymenobacter rubidus]|uniref:TlpA family protein disulfide reductase n=1 Tax=Hymenobacter rubidus TaxID=1441626 RepID=UPI00191FEB76|nr:TlpA disulfide reductase family protein [Hymenobacter rubidus]